MTIIYSYIHINFLVKEYVGHPNAVVVVTPNEIHKAYHRLTGEITDILATKNFKKLRRACYQEISAPTSTLPEDLVDELKPTKSVDDMLDVLALSPYWNWFDTRLLEALVSASGSSEAEAMLEQFKQIYYVCKVSEVLPCVIVKPIKESVIFIEKFKKDPKELTLLDLLKHKHILEYEVMDVGKNKIVLSCIRTGCIEIAWQLPIDLVCHAYTSVNKNVDKLSSLAVESLVCKVADRYTGLPILWRGQEVGEVGPIEPLPEHVRQEPYSLPQGFQWVTLSSSNVEEVVKFITKYSHFNIDNSAINFAMSHPNTKDEWQFGIRATNGKLVGVVLAHSICISIGGVSMTCMDQYFIYHPKYIDKRLWFVLVKELVRRANLCNINHLVLTMDYCLLKPITTTHTRMYSFDHPANSGQLPSSPRTPGWRRMTSEDVPSALALINKWSSQFEIRQVFNSEEEFVHYYLCPTMPNYVYTYVVENDVNNITDLVSFRLVYKAHMQFIISTVASTQSPIKQLIIDALVCAKEVGAKQLVIHNWNIKPDVLSSLSFHWENKFSNWFLIYNYKYHEISGTRVWYW